MCHHCILRKRKKEKKHVFLSSRPKSALTPCYGCGVQIPAVQPRNCTFRAAPYHRYVSGLGIIVTKTPISRRLHRAVNLSLPSFHWHNKKKGKEVVAPRKSNFEATRTGNPAHLPSSSCCGLERVFQNMRHQVTHILHGKLRPSYN